ncbi:MAG: nucleotidyltransferase domain-containing protein [Proteobacteria bacterium]|nr:nucleotidyltransferase domain-containing protein [Pseudomonadota bacterium]
MLDITQKQLTIVQEILKTRVPNRTVLAFGSRAKGTATETSDLDLVILGDEPLSSEQRSGLKYDFDESLLPFTVDIAEWASISPEFCKVITKKTITVQNSD